MKLAFGKKEYFEELFSKSSFEDDPWGHNWRASQQYRYQRYLELLRGIIGKHLRILDIGCALGDFTVQVKESLQPEEIRAIDISEEAVSRAKVKYKDSGIKFSVNSLPHLEEFKDGSFDSVLALEVLYYLGYRERIRALEEINRILKKGGFLLVSVNIREPPYFRIDEFYNLINSFFQIKKVEYCYGKIYSFFETKLLLLKRTMFKKIIRFLLSIEKPVVAGQFLTKLILGRKGITVMYILAQKAES